MNIGFIGTGSMGRTIIPLLLESGHRVSAWNRSREALVDLEGVRVLTKQAQGETIRRGDGAVQGALQRCAEAPDLMQRPGAGVRQREWDCR